MKVGMIVDRLGDSEVASRLVMNAERPKDWHDIQTEVINITLARAAAVEAHTLAGKNASNSGIQPVDVDAR